MPIFRVKSLKFTPAKKNLHEYIRGVRDKYQVWGVVGWGGGRKVAIPPPAHPSDTDLPQAVEW